MADATGTVTTNYAFKTLKGTDTAGYTSINSVITSIDTQLDDKMFVTGMVIVYQGASAPSGWTNFTSSMTASGVTLPSGYLWIKKT
jgi:hypothetical protein